VAVEDQSTGDVSFGAGVSTRGLIAEVGLNEKNFLGRGQLLGINIGYGEGQHEYNINFVDPYFLGQHISFGINAYQNQYNSISQRPFDQTLNGGALTFGFPITDDLTIQANYKILSNQISNSTKDALFFPNGSELTSSVGYAIIYSTLDNLTDPHNGLYANFSQDFAGVGGDSRYMRTIADTQFYHEINADAGIIGLLRATAGNITGIGQPVSSLDNFNKGGETVRGFAWYGYGPVALNSDGSTTSIGGKNYWATTAEVDFPLPGISPEFGLKGGVFADAGSLWGFDKPAGAGKNCCSDVNTIRSSAGVSLLWASPIGLLRADFADALTKASTDTTEWFRFSAGKRF
jgi:outer membrane protein insertion porin family